MKMRYIVVGYTLVVALLISIMYLGLTKENDFQVDMVYYNRQLKQIESELVQLTTTKEDIESIEEKYNCSILFITDGDYQQRLNTFISDGAVVFDYFSEDGLAGKIVWEMSKNRYEQINQERSDATLILVGIVALSGYILLAVIYFKF